MSSKSSRPYIPPYNPHRNTSKNRRIYQNVPDLVTDFNRNPDTSKSDTTPLLDKKKNCNCCSPFRPRRKKLSKSGKKVGKKSNKKSSKVRKNKRKTRL